MLTTNYWIIDIAYDSDFNDLSYFSKSLAAKFQCSLADYRKGYLKQLEGVK